MVVGLGGCLKQLSGTLPESSSPSQVAQCGSCFWPPVVAWEPGSCGWVCGPQECSEKVSSSLVAEHLGDTQNQN